MSYLELNLRIAGEPVFLEVTLDPTYKVVPRSALWCPD
jgi:hypothetical protein